MATAAKPKPGEAKRGFTLSREAIKVDERRVELAFSSEVPYRRYFGMEVLGHDAKEVDLARLKDGTHPLLLNHDRNIQIGVVESARVDSDKVGRAVVRFSKSAKAEEIFQDVVDGIRNQVSVAYEVHEWSKIEREEGDDDWRAIKWTPFEISIVSIAADTTVGVDKQKNTIMENENTRSKKEPEQAPVDVEKIQKEARDTEQKRTARLYELGTDFDLMPDAQKAIREGTSAEEFQAQVLVKVKERDAEAKKTKASAKPDLNVPSPAALGNGSPEQSQPAESKRSIGEIFIKSDAYAKSGYRVGQRIGARVEIPGRSSFERATLSISGQSLTSIVDLPGFVVPDRRQLRVANIFPSGPIGGGSLRYVRESSYTNAATRVAEAGTKPAATLALEQITDTVEKTAVTVKVTDEMLADFQASQGYIDNTLSYSVMQLEDTQLLSGSGSSQIRGIHNVSGINSVAVADYSSNVADALNGGIEQVRTVGNVEPTWFVINSADWHNLVRTKDSNGQYYGGGPFKGPYGNGEFSNVMDLWGIPTIVTSAQTQGTALVGNFSLGAQIFRRTGLTVEATNSNEDDFLNNLVALRAEQRMLLATFKPLAFCEITGIPA